MNKYTYSFVSKCPNNNEFVYYTLVIETEKIIMVERIIKQCTTYSEMYHENIADELIIIFPGKQTLTATHHKVKIETTRENNA